MNGLKLAVKSGTAWLVAFITFCAAAATSPTASATAANAKKKTTLTKSELLALSTAEPTFAKAGTLFGVGKATTHDEVRQQLYFQAAGAALIVCGKIDVYEQRIKDRLMDVAVDSQITKTGLVGMDGDTFSTKLINACETCEGSGRIKVKCADCNGTGICQSCGGEGRKVHRLIHGSVTKDCPTCKGKGACTKCKGHETISKYCNRCNGQGKIVNKTAALALYSKACKALANYDSDYEASVAENAARTANTSESDATPLPNDVEICTSVIGICGVYVGDDLVAAKKALAEKDLSCKRLPEEDRGVVKGWQVTNLDAEGVYLGKFSGEPIHADQIIFWTDRFGIYSLTVRVYFPSWDSRQRIRELAAEDVEEDGRDPLWLFFRNEIVKRLTELKLDYEESVIKNDRRRRGVSEGYALTDSRHSYVCGVPRNYFRDNSFALTITDLNRQKAVDQTIKSAKEKASRERYANDTNDL